jgi:hypothetical protein
MFGLGQTTLSDASLTGHPISVAPSSIWVPFGAYLGQGGVCEQAVAQEAPENRSEEGCPSAATNAEGSCLGSAETIE